MRIYHNTASLNILKQYNRVLLKQRDSLENISSGVKIKSPKDNPNKLANGEKINMRLRGTQMAGKNMQDGISLLQTAEGTLGEITESLQRIKELVVRSGAGTLSEEDKGTINNEIKSLTEGIYSMADSSDFNGVKILSQNPTSDVLMASGSEAFEFIEIPVNNIGTGGNLNLDGLYKDETVDEKLEKVDKAISDIIGIRSSYGALESRFEGTYERLQSTEETLTSSFSSLMDADIAEEMINYSKYDILAQAANAMMVQTNKMPSEILSILKR